MKIVVTGGSGFIGSHLVDRLLTEGYNVSVLDLNKPIQDVEWIKKDIRDELGDIFNGFDVIYHLAAVANARKCGEDSELCVSTNVRGTENVLQATLKGNVERVILASSCWVASAQEGEIVNENSPFKIDNINTVYGASKVSQELLCYSFWGEYKAPKYTILRYGIPYGERMWKGLVIRAFMDMAERNNVISIMGDGKQGRQFLYVGDLCHAQVLALKPIAENKIYNLPGSSLITIEEIAKEVIKYFSAQIDYVPQARVEPKLQYIQGWLAETELGWVPETSLEEGVKKCVDWWKSLTDKEKRQEYWC